MKNYTVVLQRDYSNDDPYIVHVEASNPVSACGTAIDQAEQADAEGPRTQEGDVVLCAAGETAEYNVMAVFKGHLTDARVIPVAYTYEVEVVREDADGFEMCEPEDATVWGVYRRPAEPDEDGNRPAEWLADFPTEAEAKACLAGLERL